ncbi:aspartyl-phosphate phosphatase Spo0E family protein [Paenibacillus tianmuensis]|nr:aspartyl-phosphate phosphatase Spo0E family protein [Paenibacillus tianmuensis]
MAFPEYQLRHYLNVGWIRDSEHKAKWTFGKRKQASSAVSLEDDIYKLRRQLEQLVQNGNSLTSPQVVEISMQLDIKINEYMYRPKGDRR